MIGIRHFQKHLETIGELIPKELREPWLFVNLEKSHGHIESANSIRAIFQPVHYNRAGA
jgi:hypothetical protein